jgi:hypothetical protein
MLKSLRYMLLSVMLTTLSLNHLPYRMFVTGIERALILYL